MARQRVLERSLTDEILYGRGDDIRVFVSSKMRDGSLAEERRAAIRTIESQSWHKAWAWETSAAAGPYSARRVCIANAATSDALVLIVADELTSITKSEYRAAKKSGIPRYILVKDGVARTPALDEFLTREKRGPVITVRYRNIPEFRTRVRQALRGYSLRTYRLDIARRRGLTE